MSLEGGKKLMQSFTTPKDQDGLFVVETLRLAELASRLDRYRNAKKLYSVGRPIWRYDKGGIDDCVSM